jgi:hypothetical protein
VIGFSYAGLPKGHENREHGSNINGALGQYNHVNPLNLRQVGYQPSQRLPINVPEEESR